MIRYNSLFRLCLNVIFLFFSKSHVGVVYCATPDANNREADNKALSESLYILASAEFYSVSMGFIYCIQLLGVEEAMELLEPFDVMLKNIDQLFRESQDILQLSNLQPPEGFYNCVTEIVQSSYELTKACDGTLNSFPLILKLYAESKKLLKMARSHIQQYGCKTLLSIRSFADLDESMSRSNRLNSGMLLEAQQLQAQLKTEEKARKQMERSLLKEQASKDKEAEREERRRVHADIMAHRILGCCKDGSCGSLDTKKPKSKGQRRRNKTKSYPGNLPESEEEKNDKKPDSDGTLEKLVLILSEIIVTLKSIAEKEERLILLRQKLHCSSESLLLINSQIQDTKHVHSQRLQSVLKSIEKDRSVESSSRKPSKKSQSLLSSRKALATMARTSICSCCCEEDECLAEKMKVQGYCPHCPSSHQSNNIYNPD
ncbi:hypothetical protein HWI79_1985 [Cryptosporidium felis]|nr:hypothetical protein HWI79_1985 [Cryptosporidium felis]